MSQCCLKGIILYNTSECRYISNRNISEIFWENVIRIFEEICLS